MFLQSDMDRQLQNGRSEFAITTGANYLCNCWQVIFCHHNIFGIKHIIHNTASNDYKCVLCRAMSPYFLALWTQQKVMHWGSSWQCCVPALLLPFNHNRDYETIASMLTLMRRRCAIQFCNSNNSYMHMQYPAHLLYRPCVRGGILAT